MSDNTGDKELREAQTPASTVSNPNPQTQPHDGPSRGEESESVLGRVATSASTLLHSFARPSPGDACGALNTTQFTKQAQASASAEQGTVFWEEDRRAASGAWSGSSFGERQVNFRTESSSILSTTDAEYQDFMQDAPVPVEPISHGVERAAYQTKGAAVGLPPPPPQEDILALLSMPTLTESVWAPEPYNDDPAVTDNPQFAPNLQSTYVTEFLACEDIVEFLARDDTAYTEEVWGNMLPLVRAAREEVAESKGKGKDKERSNNAVERLQKILGQLRSRL